MRRQDELLAVYAGHSPLARKYTLTQVEGFSLAFDAEESLEFLQHEIGDPDPDIREQALFSLLRFLPGFIHKRYALSDHMQGVWSQFAGRRPGVSDLADLSAGSALTRREAGFHLAEPLVASLLPAAGTDGPAQILGALALGHLRGEASRRALRQACERAPRAFVPLLAYGNFAPEDREFYLKAIERGADREPNLLLLLSFIPGQDTFRFLQDRIRRTSTIGRVNLAVALASFSSEEHAQALKRLLACPEGWVRLQCLKTLECLGSPAHNGLVRDVYRSTDHEFIRGQAVRAAAALGGDEGRDLCLAGLAEPSPAIQAQALEGLVRLGYPTDVLKELAAPLVRSRSLKLRVNAILATSDPDEVPAAVSQMLLSPVPVERLEAAYCLGYLQNQESLKLVLTLIRLEPSTLIRVQALKSLSKYPVESALGPLVGVTDDWKPRVAIAAARMVTRFAGSDATEACRLVTATMSGTRGFQRALLCRALGTLARKVGFTAAAPVLTQALDHPDQQVRAGAIEGWLSLAQFQDEAVRHKLRAIARGDTSRLAARASLALICGGDLDAIGGLARAGDGSVARLETSLELALILLRVQLSGRFPALEKALDQRARAFGVSAHPGDGVAPDPATAIPRIESADESEHGFVARRQERLHRLHLRMRASESGDGFVVRRAKRAVSVLAVPHDSRQTEERNQLARHLRDEGIQDEAKLSALHRGIKGLGYAVSETMNQGAWKPYRLMISASVAMTLVVMLVLFGVRDRVSASPVPVAPLAVSRFHGAVTLSPGKAKLSRGMPLAVGASLSTASQSEVRLLTARGGLIRVGPRTRLAVEKLSREAVSLAVDRGEHTFDFREGGTIEVSYRGRCLKGSGVWFSLQEQERSFAVVVQSGSLEIVKDGTVVGTLAPGAMEALE